MNKFFTLVAAIICVVCMSGADYPKSRFQLSQQVNIDFQVKRIQFDENYFLGNDGFYFVYGSGDVQNLSNQLDSILERLNKPPVITPPEPKPTVPESKPQPETPTTLPVTEQKPWITNPQGIDADVYIVFVNKCASCHSGSKPKGGLALVDKDREFLANLSKADRQTLFRLVDGKNLEPGERAMPLGSPALSQDQQEKIHAWVDKAP